METLIEISVNVPVTVEVALGALAIYLTRRYGNREKDDGSDGDGGDSPPPPDSERSSVPAPSGTGVQDDRQDEDEGPFHAEGGKKAA